MPVKSKLHTCLKTCVKCIYKYIYIYVYEYIRVCNCSCETCCQRSGLVPISGTMDGTRGASGWGNWPWILLTKILELQGESQRPIFVVWNWFFCNRWWITQCCLFVFGGNSWFSLRLGGIASKHFQRYLVLGLLDGIVTSVWLRWVAASRWRLVSWLKRSGIWNRRWLGFLDLWSRSGGQVMVDGDRSSGWISWPL